MYISREEFEALLGRQKNRICKIAYCYLKNIEDVQDAYQNVMERFLKNQPVFEGEEHEKAWFITTTANVCKNMCDSFWKKKVTLYDAEQNEDESAQNTKNHKVITMNRHRIMLEETSDLSYQAELVADNVAKLPEKYRIVIHLFYYDGYSTEEIAEVLQMTGGSVRTQLNRARNMLKESLKWELYEVKGGICNESKSL